MSPTEKSALRKVIDTPLFREAVDEVCTALWLERRNPVDMQAAALSFAYSDGVCAAFSKLYQQLDLKAEVAMRPNRLRPVQG